MYHINPKIIQTPITDDKILLLEPQGGLYFELNESSVLIYQGIQASLSESELIASLTQEYAIEYETAKADTLEILQQFLSNNIIQLKDC